MLWLLAGCKDLPRTSGTAAAEELEEKGEVIEIAMRLAKENACEDPQELFSRHFTELLRSVVGPGPVAPVERKRAGQGNASSTARQEVSPIRGTPIVIGQKKLISQADLEDIAMSLRKPCLAMAIRALAASAMELRKWVS